MCGAQVAVVSLDEIAERAIEPVQILVIALLSISTHNVPRARHIRAVLRLSVKLHNDRDLFRKRNFYPKVPSELLQPSVGNMLRCDIG